MQNLSHLRRYQMTLSFSKLKINKKIAKVLLRQTDIQIEALSQNRLSISMRKKID